MARPRFAFRAPQTAPETPGNVKLADDLYIVRVPGEAAVVAQTSRDGVLLVDGGSAAGSDAVLKAVAALPNGSGKIHTLFNTHWHPEQTGSNEKLGTAGATIIAQENTRLWLQQNITWPWNGQKFKKLAKIAQPNKTFYDKGDSRLRSPLRLHLRRGPHRRRSLRLLPAAERPRGGRRRLRTRLAGGRLVDRRLDRRHRRRTATHPDASPTRKRRSFPRAARCSAYADIAAQVEMYGTIYDRLNQMLNKGHSPSEGVEAKPAKEFEAKMGNPDEFIRRSFESLWAYLSPDA